MKSDSDIISILKLILTKKGSDKLEYIISFQKEVFDDETVIDEELDEVLSDLAYDLDFYEPNEERRKSNSNLRSEQYINELIGEAIEKIENCAKKNGGWIKLNPSVVKHLAGKRSNWSVKAKDSHWSAPCKA